MQWASIMSIIIVGIGEHPLDEDVVHVTILTYGAHSRQRERDKTIGSNEKTNALHVRFKFWYISSPNSAK